MIGGVRDVAGAVTARARTSRRRQRRSPEAERRPRIVIVAWKLGGELALAIEKGSDRFEFAVISMTLPDELRSLVEWHPMPLLRFNSFRLEWAMFFVRAGLRLRRTQADLVHTVGPTPVIPNRVDLNTVTFCHAAYHEVAAARGIEGTSFGWRFGEPIARALERWWFNRRVRTLAGLSEGGAAQLRRHYPRNDVVVLPRGLDLERFRPDPGVRQALRRKLAVGPDDVVAIFVDQDRRPLKGLDVAIEAVAAARRAGSSVRLWIVGSGNERSEVLVQELGLDDAVRFCGYRAHLERYYQAADVFVLPSAYETFSRSGHEAAACGLPLVATRVGGLDELIGEDEAGIAVDREAADVARGLSALSGDASLRARMRTEALNRAAAFDVRTVAQRTLEVYERLLDTRRPIGAGD